MYLANESMTALKFKMARLWADGEARWVKPRSEMLAFHAAGLASIPRSSARGRKKITVLES